MDKKTKLLVVDDDLGMSETLSDILGEKGFLISVANDGYKAIEMINKYDYDLALIDIVMPRINGVKLYKEIKQIRPTLKVVMMTAYSVESLVKEALKDGAYGIAYKPLDIEALLSFFQKIEKGILILVLDDNQHFCETLKDRLEELKYKVDVKYEGEQAIKFIKENDVDIIFIDIKMPTLNGLDFYLLTKEINPDIIGVMITGYWQEEAISNMIEVAFENNLYACLHKPLNQEEIIALIEDVGRSKIKIKEIPGV